LARNKQPHICETELHSLHNSNEPHPEDAPPEYQSEVDFPMDVGPPALEATTSAAPTYLSHEDEAHESEAPSQTNDIQINPEILPAKDEEKRRKRIIRYTIIGYCTFRAMVTSIVNILSLIDKHTTPSAPSTVLLILVSTQITASNQSLSRILRLLLSLDILLLAVSFTIVSFAPMSSATYPSYGSLTISGGNCPVYASNCHKQTTHWDEIGCGHYTTYIGADNNDDEEPQDQFYHPYAKSGSVNSGANALKVVEWVITIFGTIWLLSVLFQLWEARHLFSAQRRETKRVEGPQKSRRRCAPNLFFMLILFGVFGAFVAMFMSIGGHMSQALGTHHATFIDSFGPVVPSNTTLDNEGYVSSVDYWGNSTSWSDCFTVTAPRSGSGFWNQWVTQNKHSLYRIAAGV